MTKIVTIGGATQDIFIQSRNPRMIDLQINGSTQSFLALQNGTKVEVDGLDYYTGGGATNSSTSFARFGLDAYCCIKTGNDDQAEHIVDQLKKNNVTVYQAISDTMATGTSFILPTKNNDHVALVWRGANTQLKQSDIPEAVITAADCVYITSLSDRAAAMFLPIAQRVKKAGKKVATNPGTSQLGHGADLFVKALSCIDILVLNSYEAQLCMESLIDHSDIAQSGTSNAKSDLHSPEIIAASRIRNNVCYFMKDFFRTVLQLGPEVVVLTNGKEGVYVAFDDTLLFHPSLPTHISNTLGAGDAFSSFFVASIISGNDIQTAVLNGLFNAQSVIEKLDTKSGILTYEMLIEKSRSYAKKSLDEFQYFKI